MSDYVGGMTDFPDMASGGGGAGNGVLDMSMNLPSMNSQEQQSEQEPQELNALQIAQEIDGSYSAYDLEIAFDDLLFTSKIFNRDFAAM